MRLVEVVQQVEETLPRTLLESMGRGGGWSQPPTPVADLAGEIALEAADDLELL